MNPLVGGAELGGTKCILAVSKSPIDILHRTVIPTTDPQKTLQKIFSFFNNSTANSPIIPTVMKISATLNINQ